MSVIERVRQAMLGEGLLTVNKVCVSAANADEFELQRLWSSNPKAYPVAGMKRKTLTPWSRQLLLCREIFVGQGEAVLAAVFDDHTRITALGLRCVVNVPLLMEGRCAATFNVLGCQAQWQPREVTMIRLFAALATPLILQGTEPLASTPEYYGEYIQKELARWECVVKQTGITLE